MSNEKQTARKHLARPHSPTLPHLLAGLVVSPTFSHLLPLQSVIPPTRPSLGAHTVQTGLWSRTHNSRAPLARRLQPIFSQFSTRFPTTPHTGAPPVAQPFSTVRVPTITQAHIPKRPGSGVDRLPDMLYNVGRNGRKWRATPTCGRFRSCRWGKSPLGKTPSIPTRHLPDGCVGEQTQAHKRTRS